MLFALAHALGGSRRVVTRNNPGRAAYPCKIQNAWVFRWQASGAHATPLRFLDVLIHRPLPAALLYRYGVLVNVPQPARYAVHKLIVSVRRVETVRAKAEKDIRQAAELIAVLAEAQPDALQDAWTEARGRGPK